METPNTSVRAGPPVVPSYFYSNGNPLPFFANLVSVGGLKRERERKKERKRYPFLPYISLIEIFFIKTASGGKGRRASVLTPGKHCSSGGGEGGGICLWTNFEQETGLTAENATGWRFGEFVLLPSWRPKASLLTLFGNVSFFQ
jgi:hypothetical protein